MLLLVEAPFFLFRQKFSLIFIKKECKKKKNVEQKKIEKNGDVVAYVIELEVGIFFLKKIVPFSAPCNLLIFSPHLSFPTDLLGDLSHPCEDEGWSVRK